MQFDFLYGFIGIIALTVFCLPGAFMVPQIAYQEIDNSNEM